MALLTDLKKSIDELPYEDAFTIVAKIQMSRVTKKVKSKKKKTTLSISELTGGLSPEDAKEMLAKLSETFGDKI